LISAVNRNEGIYIPSLPVVQYNTAECHVLTQFIINPLAWNLAV
jgi:hypothetical protein